jgi:hypothetical protein
MCNAAVNELLEAEKGGGHEPPTREACVQEPRSPVRRIFHSASTLSLQ